MAEAEQQSQGRPRCPGRRLVRSDVSGCLRVIVRRRYQNMSRRTVGLSRRVAHDHTTLYFVRDGFHRLQNDVRHPVSVPVFAAQHYGPASHDRVCFECFLVARYEYQKRTGGTSVRPTEVGHCSRIHLVWSQPQPSTHLDLSLRISGSDRI